MILLVFWLGAGIITIKQPRLIQYLKRIFPVFSSLILLINYFLFNQLYFLNIVVLMIAIWFVLLYLQAKAQTNKSKAKQIEESDYNKIHAKQFTRQLKMARLIADNHAQELAIRRALLPHKSPDGSVNDAKWEKEITLFTLNHIKPVTGDIRGEFGENCDHLVRKAIEDAINDFERHSPLTTSSKTFSLPLSRYEQFVVDLLSGYGWKTRKTVDSDNQGSYVIAEKQSIKVVLQCKLYSNNVDDTVVQEIITSKVFKITDFAAIVSNAAFSEAAQQLASSAGLFLLHHDQLEKLESMCWS